MSWKTFWPNYKPASIVLARGQGCEVFDVDGNLLGYPDLLDVEAGIAVEYDGDDHRRLRDALLRQEQLPTAALDALMARPHVQIAPPVRNRQDDELALLCLAATLLMHAPVLRLQRLTETPAPASTASAAEATPQQVEFDEQPAAATAALPEAALSFPATAEPEPEPEPYLPPVMPAPRSILAMMRAFFDWSAPSHSATS